MRRLLAPLACSMILSLGVPAAVDAAGVVGNGTPASCTKQAFVAALVGGGLVTFQCGPAPKTIIVDTTLIENGTTTTIDGGGLVTLDGEELRQHFFVLDGGDLTLRNITLRLGSAGAGGALHNGGTARLERVTLDGNFAAGTFGGGAIYNLGELTVTDSAFLLNRAAASGGAIFNSGEGTATIDRCLFRANDAVDGGAIALQGGAIEVTNSSFLHNGAEDGGAIHLVGGLIDLQNATFTENLADHGGAVFLGPGVLSARNTVFSNSLDPDLLSEALECDGTGGAVASLGGNLASDGSCQLGGEGDQNNIDPALDGIADNGGPTMTMLPAPGSPLIDAGLDEGCPAVDQRGFPRPRDGDDPDLDPECDIGAVEVPEPAAPGLVAFAALAATARRRTKRIR